MKILITCVGRRVELVQAFRTAAGVLNMELCIYGADASADAPALCFCDRKLIVKRIGDEGYMDQLLAICKEETIDLVIPTIDTELQPLADNKQQFAAIGTKVMISGSEFVADCSDKQRTAALFTRCGLNTPETAADPQGYTGGFPCIVKPTRGSASKGIFIVSNQQQLDEYQARLKDCIIQQYVDGIEYTVDILCDFQGRPIHITPRQRIEIRCGEVQKTRIVQDDKIIQKVKKLIDQVKPCGAVTVQLIRQHNTNEDFFIEINPRFGGGSPLSMKAGADSAQALLRIVAGENLTYHAFAASDQCKLSRFDQSVFVSGNHQRIQAAVFDLDDTLYPEKDYVYSGLHAVAILVPYIKDAEHKLRLAFAAGKPAIDTLLKDEGIYNEALKDRCLTAYREHIPAIRLYQSAEELLKTLKKKGVLLGLLTDGRPSGQRKKIAALGLDKLMDTILITDDLGGETFRKPNDIAFRIIQHRLNVPYNRMVYIGDNPKKDFSAPKRLGMQTIWFCNRDGLYTQLCCSAEAEIIADRTIVDLKELSL